MSDVAMGLRTEVHGRGLWGYRTEMDLRSIL